MKRKVGWVLGLVFGVFTFSAMGQLTRVPNTTLAMPSSPPTRGYALQQAFSRVFVAPVALATPPGETDRIFVVEQQGTIQVIRNINSATPTISTFLDIRSRLVFGGEQGLLGLAFHPNYAENGYFYVFYTTSGTRHDRLSRFTVSASNTNQANAASELTLINQLDEASNHNGGDLHFGPDGYLYVALGDEGAGGDSLANSQRIDKDFFAGVLRIDVDKRPGNLPANAHAAATSNYLVPADNPFVGATSFNGITLANPSRVRTEFWATGLRNPWRMSFDPLTGALWLGDVGQGAREEIDIIVKGGNYGWNYREGFIAYTGTPPPGFVRVDPVYDYPRGSGYSVTGGRVYRGNNISHLYGAYIFGDYGSGQIWALRLNEAGRGVVTRLITDSGVAAFGVDPSNGDILVCDVNDGRIRRLVATGAATGAPIPPTLAETGAFSDLTALTPHPGIVPYELNLPFWSDGAAKTRWFSIPDVSKTMTFDPTNTWLTPTGSVWIKHFEMQMTNGEPASARRLETRFIVRNNTGVYGVTYRWTNETSAVLAPEEGLDEELAIHDGGTIHTQVWRYPSRSECLACHNDASGWVLGFNTAQLNREATHGALTANQIAALSSAGYLQNPPDEPHGFHALARPDDAAVSQEFRVRSWLAANCAQCHRPGGLAIANFDARISTPTDLANLVNGMLVNDGGDPQNKALAPNSIDHSMILRRISIRGEGQMPPIASNIPDPAGVELMRSFILGDLATRQSFAEWQVARFNEPLPPEAAATADPDADGAVNLLEYLTSGNPIQGGDAWALRASANPGGFEIRFQNPPNRGVVVEVAEALPGEWRAVDHPDNRPLFPASGAERAITDAIFTDAARYYRARIFAP